jgi:hypothetical protein
MGEMILQGKITEEELSQIILQLRLKKIDRFIRIVF